MAIVYRNIIGTIKNSQGSAVTTGELRVKALSPIIDGTDFLSPEEVVVAVANGTFTLQLAAPSNYEFKVIDEQGETIWDFQAPLSNDSGDDISLAELFVATGYEEPDIISAITAFLGMYSGAGSPEGVVTATVGAIYTRTDGGTDTTLYVKESGTGNTGWVAK